jgi:hypothetical protein
VGANNQIAQKASRLIAIWSTVRTRVRVSCPSNDATPNTTMRCSRTRRDGSRPYHDTVAVTFDDSSHAEIGSLDVQSTDEGTGTIMDYRCRGAA